MFLSNFLGWLLAYKTKMLALYASNITFFIVFHCDMAKESLL